MAWNQIRVASSLAQHQLLLKNHPIYNQINSIESLRIFMKNHSYIVFNHSSLIKSLQSKFEINAFPYFLPKNSKQANFIENLMIPSSDRYSFSYMYNLYINAMQEIGAFSEPIESMVSTLKAGNSWKDSYERHIKDYSLIVLPETLKFIDNSIKVARDGAIHKICAYFLYPADNVVSDIFQKMATKFNSVSFNKYIESQTGMFNNELDTIKETIKVVCGEDSLKWEEVFLFGKMAIEEKLTWLDAISNNMNKPTTIYEKIGGKKEENMIINNFILENWSEIASYSNENYSENFIATTLGGPASVNPKLSILEDISSILWISHAFNEAKINCSS
ncbi:unnamed protein product [Blepharisma stoltei]|uniref:Uncharacterized protein n=1 Tax=Blepharisma stoltei TaxID=1481888 RepID=A0AAU9IIG5_9CILI|nr:unnamed protein product [Blepharisma stoltei]